MKSVEGTDIGEVCETEMAVFSGERWYFRSREDLIQSATSCHDAQVLGL